MDSYDVLFHMNRIQSLGNIFVSPVNFDYWGHVGNMTSIFYPWLTILPGFVIFSIAGNPAVGYLVFLTLITFLTFVSSYFFMKKFSDNTLQSFLFSIIYTLAFFRMASVFYRAGLAEFICYIFIPMLFYEFYQLLIGNFNKWALFALSFTLIVLTHPLTAFTTVVIMLPILILVLFSKISHHWKYWGKLFLSGIGAILAVCITTIGFTLPMIQQQKYISVNRPALLGLSSTAKDPYVMFKDAMGSDLRSYSFGIILLLAVAFFVFFVWTDKLKYKIVGVEMIVSLILSTNLIPWDQLQHTFFNYLQFPWRFLNLFTFFAAVYLSYILAKLVNKRSPILKLLMMILVLVGCSMQVYNSGSFLNRQLTLVKAPNKLDSANSSKLVQKFTQGDYYPTRSLDYKHEIRHRVSYVNGKKTTLPANWNQNSYSVSYYNQRPVYMDLPVLVYKGLSLTINNETSSYQISKRGTIRFKTKPGQNQIQLKYSYSNVAKIAIVVNIIGFIVLTWLILNDGKIINKNHDKSSMHEKTENS
jgi:hypothetical protein